MAAFYLVLAGVLFYLVGYRFYSAILDRKVLEIRDDVPTPAVELNDGIDFVPARVSLLFGHHFASIAGAGPIIGPIVALSMFGWLPAFIWIVLGSIFIGAVHDYVTLMLSVRHKGVSIAQIATTAIGSFSCRIFSFFLVLAMILVVTVFGAVSAKTLVVRPQMVIPTLMLIPTAIIFGRLINKKGTKLTVPTIFAVSANIVFIVIGYFNPVSLPEHGIFGILPFDLWFILLLAYAAVSSIMPVHILLQPRDYISSFNLYFAMGLGVFALLLLRPSLNAPLFISFWSASGKPLWPMMFVLVACGAISGFHSLVSSGTSSKQLPKESAGRVIGYGSMLMEGFLAVMTLMMAASALYWVKPAGIDVDMSTLGFYEVLKEKGWVVVFGNSFGKLVSDLFPFMGFGISSMIAMTALKTFILTTLDTATRITRFIVSESVGESLPLFRNKYVAISVVILPSLFLGLSNNWQKIWPIFGATNQLIGAVALLVASAYLIGIKKPVAYTLFPALFMIVTTIAAMVFEGYNYMFSPTPNYTLGVIAAVLTLLAAFVGAEGLSVIFRKSRNEKQAGADETVMAEP